MKFHLSVQANPHVSYTCEGWAESEPAKEPATTWQVRLSNSSIAGLITGRMGCQIALPGNREMRGEILKTRDNLFVIEKLKIQ